MSLEKHNTEDLDQMNDKQATNIFHNRFTAWIVLLFSLVFTAFAYFASVKSVEKRSMERFEYRSETIANDIRERMRIYEQTLRGAVGLFNSTDHVSREMFREYVKTLDVNTYWPGIQGIGYSIPISPSEKLSHEKQIQDEGFPEFRIKPEGVRDLYTSIIYLEPFDWRNQRAFGYDMWSNDMRREAMIRARDAGIPATSGAIVLVQETDEDVQKGFLTYLPVYKTKEVPQTIQMRREAFVGWIYCPFRAGDLMKGIIGEDDPEIEFKIYDGELVTEESLLYRSKGHVDAHEEPHEPTYSKTVFITLQGRLWTIHFKTPNDYLSSFHQSEPRMIAFGGITLDLLLFYAIWSFYYVQKRASIIACQMTRDLEKTKRSLEIKVKTRTAELEQSRAELEKRVDERTAELEEKMSEMEVMNTAMVDRELNTEKIRKENVRLKLEIENLKKKS